MNSQGGLSCRVPGGLKRIRHSHGTVIARSRPTTIRYPGL
jgi:hypothetical protein